MTDPSRPVVLLTGAGAGIGAAAARRFVREGWCVGLVARTRAKLEAVADDIGREHAEIIALDLAEPAAAATAVAAVNTRWGRLDALVNNAGLARLSGIPETDETLLRDIFAINAFAPMRLIASAWPHLCESGGTVVNVSSVAAADPFPGLCVYAGAKSAVESFTRSVAGEGAEHGIAAWSVAPGAVETAMLRGLFDEDALPATQTLDPDHVASVVVEAALRQRPEASGSVITVLPEASMNA